MTRGTGVFQQREFLDKLRRLEEQVARTKAAADEMARKAQERSAQDAATRGASGATPTSAETKPKA
jgi:hypothetical protein